MEDENRTAECSILLLEDDPTDRELIVSVLNQGGIRCRYLYAADAAEFAAALAQGAFDLILADFSVPSFNGMEALAMARSVKPDVPFILVSGMIGEEEAVECVKKGATDYVLKSRLERLVLAARRALGELQERSRRKAAERALKESEARFRRTLTHTPFVAVRWYDGEGRVTFWNPAAEQLFGYTAEEALGRELHPTHDPADGARTFKELLRQVGDSGKPAGPAEHRFQRRDGPLRTCISTVFDLARPPEPSCFVCMDVDITEQKKAEEALRVNMARVLQQENALVALTRPPHSGDLHASIRRITETSATVLRVERVSFWRCAPVHSVMHCVDLFHLSDRQHSAGAELSRSDFPTYFNALEHSEIIAADDARAHPLTAEFTEPYLKPLGISSMLDVPIRIKGTLHGVLCHEHVGPRRHWTSDERAFAIAVANHVTLLIEEWERQQLEIQFRQAQKMEAIGQLAGGVAHDFNNLLAVIQMQSSLLIEETGLSAGVRESIQEITDAVQRASNLTRQLLSFSRRKVKQPQNLDLSILFSTTLKLLKRVVPESITLEHRFPASLPVVHADPGMIEQVLMNLVINASDAMPGGGHLQLSLEAAEVSEERAAVHPGVAPGPFICLTVSDNGAGIPPEHLPRIFEPFFTTKEEGRGSGLGLPTARNIVEQHRGWIEAESETGHGTTFRVFLPAIREALEPAAAQTRRDEVRGGREVILLVEDDPAVRSLARSVLERYGYKVLEAATASAALKIWESNRALIDLLIADLILPDGLSGRELAERLQSSKPDLKVIFSSGYSPEIITRELGLDPLRDVLQKPYSAVDLAAIVRRAVDDLAALRTTRFAAAVQIYKG